MPGRIGFLCGLRSCGSPQDRGGIANLSSQDSAGFLVASRHFPAVGVGWTVVATPGDYLDWACRAVLEQYFGRQSFYGSIRGRVG